VLINGGQWLDPTLVNLGIGRQNMGNSRTHNKSDQSVQILAKRTNNLDSALLQVLIKLIGPQIKQCSVIFLAENIFDGKCFFGGKYFLVGNVGWEMFLAGNIFGEKHSFCGKCLFFGGKCFWQEIFLAGNIFGGKYFKRELGSQDNHESK
jgi:hypothetical protein